MQINAFIGVKGGGAEPLLTGETPCPVGEVYGGQVTPASFLYGVPVREDSHEGDDGLFLLLGETEFAKLLPVEVG